MLSIATVLGLSALGGKGSLGWYRVVLNKVLISVDFPNPDSPCENIRMEELQIYNQDKPTTIAVNWKPFLTLFL
jgi:hypothetical protein